MTELMQIYLENREKAQEKIKTLDFSLLLAELDDTLQLDILKVSTAEYIKLPQSKMGVYRAIIKELSDRLIKGEK